MCAVQALERVTLVASYNVLYLSKGRCCMQLIWDLELYQLFLWLCMACFVLNVYVYLCVSLLRHSPFRSSNAKSKEEIDHQTLNKVCNTQYAI